MNITLFHLLALQFLVSLAATLVAFAIVSQVVHFTARKSPEPGDEA